ncbi:hypothetical protein [Streptomyces sp. NBC_00233]|uniref:hypothetical protein n=1 Tax=Streptomyces sp. NBC_00233 TaxID=2975686 RepID=UPI0022599738|nr:hypothetical protein [Streptomyces sp. NBC_00233]MCX5233055.1 hypothetical protein [Streptomyces sp. NBC_00233]
MLRDNEPNIALLDRPLAECDWAGDSPTGCSANYRRYGVNIQVFIGPASERSWISLAAGPPS